MTITGTPPSLYYILSVYYTPQDHTLHDLHYTTHNAPCRVELSTETFSSDFAELSDVWSISNIVIRPDPQGSPTQSATPHLPTITEE
jgi:hypothetical protein